MTDETIPAAPVLTGARLGLAVVLLVLVGAIWGSTYAIAKIVTEAGFHPFGMTLWQGLGGGIILAVVCLARRRLPRLGPVYLRFYLICGFLGTALPSAVWFWVAPKLQSGIVAITAALVPMVTLALALAFRVERFEAKRTLGIGLGFAAMLLIILPETSLPDRSMVIWVVVALAIPVCYASENMVITLLRPPAMDTLSLLCGMMWAAALVVLPLVALSGGWVDVLGPWQGAHWLLFLLILLNALSYGLFIELLRMAGPVFAAQEGYIITVAGIVWGMLIFGEQHSPWVWLAIAVMFAGFALVSPRVRGQAA